MGPCTVGKTQSVTQDLMGWLNKTTEIGLDDVWIIALEDNWCTAYPTNNQKYIKKCNHVTNMKETWMNLQLPQSACQTLLCNTARHLRFHILFGTHLKLSRTHVELVKQRSSAYMSNNGDQSVTHRKSRTPELFACFRGFHEEGWYDPATSPLKLAGV